jgi:DNA-binding NtrC family response regulator
MEGLAGIDTHGRLAWVNNVAARLLGVQQGAAGLHADDVFGLDARHLASLTRETGSAAHRLPNGLNVWLMARMQARDGLSQPAFQVQRTPTAAPSATTAVPGTLRESDRDLVARTVKACDGNVSKAARQLGVSRGLVYRHLNAASD